MIPDEATMDVLDQEYIEVPARMVKAGQVGRL